MELERELSIRLLDLVRSRRLAQPKDFVVVALLTLHVISASCGSRETNLVLKIRMRRAGSSLVTRLSLYSMRATSVYVHFPWCIKKCPYCDFATRAIAE